MKSRILLLAALITLFLPACNDTGKPLASGVVVSGTIWVKPHAGALSNSGTPIPVDTKVDIYDRLIVIHQADGTRKVVPMDYVTDLVIK